MSVPIPGLIVAAPASGNGKTVVTLGLLRHFADAGHSVVSAKIGPDYIDPAFHARASGRACRNLDTWAMRTGTLSESLAALAGDGEFVICEGVMGLFDGASGVSAPADGSTAAASRLVGWPIVLVVDASAQAASAAALVRGFATHDSDVPVAGVIFNRVGSKAHARILKDACAATLPDIPVLACLPKFNGLELPSRHLGLVQAVEHPDLEMFVDQAAQWIKEHVDVDGLLALCRAGSDMTSDAVPDPVPPLGARIAVAEDEAFAFTYPHILSAWQGAGSELTKFSPLNDQAPDPTADAVYLPGGYPELHAGKLADAAEFLTGLRVAAERGATVFGECGGYMVLGETLMDADGTDHRMAGLLPLRTSFRERRLHLGYRQATMKSDGFLGPSGTIFRGHEFHYASVIEEAIEETGTEPMFSVTNAAGESLGSCGLTRGSVAGSFVHLIDKSES